MSGATRVLLWGAGGHGKVVADVLRACGAEIVGYAEGEPARIGFAAEPGGARVRVGESSLLDSLRSGAALPAGADAVFLAMGDNRSRLAHLAAAADRLAEHFVHPRAWASPSAAFGRGTVAMAGVVVNAAAQVGRTVILNSGAVVEHDCVLRDGVHLSPGAVLAGGVRVGAGSWIGAGATVIQGVAIGEGAIVGAGAVVIRDVPDHATVVGNPARTIRTAPHPRRP